MCEHCRSAELALFDQVILGILLASSSVGIHLSRDEICNSIGATGQDKVNAFNMVAESIKRLSDYWVIKGSIKSTIYGNKPTYIIDIEQSMARRLNA